MAKLLSTSKKPVLHLGHGVKISNASSYLRKLINKFKIPFALTWNASDLIGQAIRIMWEDQELLQKRNKFYNTKL